MLVLTRKRSEMIQIGENIVIKIIQTGKSTVKIGIEAPENVRVLRGELEPHTGSSYLVERLKKLQAAVAEESSEGEEHLVGSEVSCVTADFS